MYRNSLFTPQQHCLMPHMLTLKPSLRLKELVGIFWHNEVPTVYMAYMNSLEPLPLVAIGS